MVRSMKVPLFASLTDAELRLITHCAYEDTAAAGELIVRRWDPSREFYVILEGKADVRTAEEHFRTLQSCLMSLSKDNRKPSARKG